MSNKIYLDKNVLECAIERIEYIFDNFEKIYLSFSGGKDSSVMLHLVMDEAIKRNRKIGLLFIDLEGQYKITIAHIREMIDEYKNYIDLYWISLPLSLRNAVSQYEPKWECWQPGKDWIRELPKESINKISHFDWFYEGMEFEDFVVKFGEWYGDGDRAACFVGIRSDESLNRYRTIKREYKNMFKNKRYTSHVTKLTYNVYPIYDWKTKDIWIYNSKFNKKYNHLYDLMHQAGLSIHQQRICQPYGDDQRKGLWLYHVIEPETWGKLIARVNGANFGSIYVCETGNVCGNIKISLPPNHTWESFAKLLLSTMPEKSKNHFENKILIFLRWWGNKDPEKYKNGIPDFADKKLESSKKVPSWRRICKTLLRNDYWCKGLSFSQTTNDSYKKYLLLMERRKKLYTYQMYLNNIRR